MISNIVISVKNMSKQFTHWNERQDSFKKLLNSVLTLNFKWPTSEKYIVLDNVSFDINRGQFIGIMGKNGVGKSTILKILSQIYSPNSGSVEVYGKIASLLELGAGFEPELTGYENIFLYASLLGYSKAEIQRKKDLIIEFSGLGEKINQAIKNYSSGMLVRLGFSIATHLDADILFFDEVLAVGDLAFQSKCLKKINELHSLGKTIILVTHSPEQVEQFCDRCILFNNKKIEFDGDGKNGAIKYRELFHA